MVVNNIHLATLFQTSFLIALRLPEITSFYKEVIFAIQYLLGKAVNYIG